MFRTVISLKVTAIPHRHLYKGKTGPAMVERSRGGRARRRRRRGGGLGSGFQFGWEKGGREGGEEAGRAGKAGGGRESGGAGSGGAREPGPRPAAPGGGAARAPRATRTPRALPPRSGPYPARVPAAPPPASAGRPGSAFLFFLSRRPASLRTGWKARPGPGSRSGSRSPGRTRPRRRPPPPSSGPRRRPGSETEPALGVGRRKAQRAGWGLAAAFSLHLFFSGRAARSSPAFSRSGEWRRQGAGVTTSNFSFVPGFPARWHQRGPTK